MSSVSLSSESGGLSVDSYNNNLPVNGNARHLNLLKDLLADDSISEIMINRFDQIFLEKDGRLQRAPFVFASPEQVMEIATMLLQWCGKQRHADAQPIIDGTLPDGNRLNIILPPVAVEGASISIRKFPRNPLTLDAMVTMGLLTAQMAQFLKASARGRVNILVSGGTSSGKTTLLNALSAHINNTERLVTIEDTPELQIQQENVVRMITYDAHGLPGGDITPRDLVRSSLRIRPDRIIMGEIRGVEAFDLLQAINTGHDGSMATIHANSPREAFSRLELLVSMGNSGLSTRYVRQQISASLDLVIQASRDENGQRCITHITEIIGLEGDVLVAQDLFLLKMDKDGKASYIWANVSSRNAKIQKAIVEANAFKG